MGELNVEKIMEEIRSEIKAKGYTNDMLSFRDITPDEEGVSVEKFEKVRFNEELYNVNMRWNINANCEIERKTGLKGKCVTLFKMFIRKCIRFYLSIIVMDQVAFNATTVRLFNLLNLYMEENSKLLEEVNRLKEEQRVLTSRINELYDSHRKE